MSCVFIVSASSPSDFFKKQFSNMTDMLNSICRFKKFYNVEKIEIYQMHSFVAYSIYKQGVVLPLKYKIEYRLKKSKVFYFESFGELIDYVLENSIGLYPNCYRIFQKRKEKWLPIAGDGAFKA